MIIENACFISYRNTGDEGANKLIAFFVKQLKKHIALYMSDPVFFDQDRLNVGDQYNEELASAICKSACMVLLISPHYFDERNSYCAREYKGMLKLQELRTSKTSPCGGLIIPLLVGHDAEPPEEIKSHTHFAIFKKAHNKAYIQGEKCQKKLNKIASVIHKKHTCMKSLEKWIDYNCNDFQLPTEEAIRDWLRGCSPFQLKMPGH